MTKKNSIQVMSPANTLAALAFILTSAAQAQPTGTVATFTSPNGLQEVCIATPHLPGGTYPSADVVREQQLCGLNFYDDSVALCPKNWSTSPGTIIDDIRKTGLTSAQAEAKYCGPKETSLKAWAKFKQTMNQNDTSATFSYSSIMYYHLSRALDAKVHVPVAVYRTMDRVVHYQRVSSHAKPMGRLNAAGWTHVQAAETSPATYGLEANDFLTPDRSEIYGILVDGGGIRYGAEVNGTRALGSLVGQNYEMQQTPASFALRSELPLQQAITAGITQAFADPKMAAAFPLVNGLPQAPSNVQMNSWMRETSEIALLDYILDQQDRVGNIDYKWKWLYLDANGDEQELDEKAKAPRTQMGLIETPASIASFKPVLVQKSIIADNDAGGYGHYANEARSSGALDGVPRGNDSKPVVNSVPKHEAIHHMALETYRQLITLSKDFSSGGEISKTFATGLGFTTNRADKERIAIVRNNLMRAAEMFRGECATGHLLFDIVSDKDALSGKFTADSVADCGNP